MQTTIEWTDVATVPGQRSDAAGTERFAAQLADALGRLAPTLDPTAEGRDRARQRIAALLAS